MSPNASNVGANSSSICNAELPATRETFSQVVLDWLSCHSEKLKLFKSQAGLTPDHPQKYQRERHEIVAGKLLLLEKLSEEAELLQFPIPNPVSSPKTLTVEKPSPLSVLRDAVAVCEKIRVPLGISPLSDEADFQWHRASESIHSLNSLILTLSGSAEEQPLNREETRPVIMPGGVVTPDASNPPTVNAAFMHWIGEALPRLDPAELCFLSEAVLVRMDALGLSDEWKAVD